MPKALGRLVVFAIGLVVSSAGAQSRTQAQSAAEAAWRARRAADSVCATYPRTRSSARGRVHRDPATGTECRKSQPPTLTAYVLTDHLICPSATPWNDVNPLTWLKPERIARIEFGRDSLTLARWRCPSAVDAVVLVIAKPPGGT